MTYKLVNTNELKSLVDNVIKMYPGMTGMEYARQEAWDIQTASNVLSYVASMCIDELQEPDDVQSLANIMRSLIEFINGEISDLVLSAKQGQEEYAKTVPAEVKEQLDLSYVKSLHVEIPEKDLAVKYISRNTIIHPVFIWGDIEKTDLEADYFTKSTDFWDEALKEFVRPLTWEHGQDKKFSQFEDNPVIGRTVKFHDDDIARWAESIIETDKQYRKYIDQFIDEKLLGYSSDSAPQYVIRERQGKAKWIKAWPWFGGALTASPCEPRMKVYTPEFLKSLGIALPDNPPQEDWEAEKMVFEYLRTKYTF